MLIDSKRAPQSEFEENLCSEPFEKLLNLFNLVPGIREQYPSDDILKQWVNSIILSAIEAHLSNNNDSANWYVRFESGLDEELTGQLQSVAVGLSYNGILVDQQIEQTEEFEFRLSDEFLEQHPKLKAMLLKHSRPSDVHKWSDHPEVNTFVDSIYNDHFTVGYANIQKKHIKTLLLDLYVAWKDDPALKITVDRSPNAYQSRTRYNELRISRTTIDVVDVLIEQGLILEATGFYDPITNIGRTTRIWPTPKLLKMFEDARWGPMDIATHPDRECIILHDNNKDDQEYEDTVETNQMREKLRNYNALLARTFIDIPTLEKPYINRPDFDEGGYDEDQPETGNDRIVYVNQNHKFVRRIFNRSSFNLGGRFYGGWWQRCPKKWREHIFLNDRAVSEIDYSGLHIVLLYAREGIDYWGTVNTDPYTIEPLDFIATTKQSRAICKGLLLVALNAADDSTSFKAFRAAAKSGSYEKKLKDVQLAQVLASLREKHQPIAHMIANDAGIELMNTDSKIAELVIQHFTEQEIPVLCIHDSFIVPYGYESELEEIMVSAFERIAGVTNANLTHSTYDPLAVVTGAGTDLRETRTVDTVRSEITERLCPTKTERYEIQKSYFSQWLIDNDIEAVDTTPWDTKVREKVACYKGQ